jgi:predicted secreted protein
MKSYFVGTTKDENVMNSLVLSVHTESPIKLEMTNILIKYELEIYQSIRTIIAVTHSSSSSVPFTPQWSIWPE